ncbi:MAG: hypothetical protein HWQ43_23350 [Nostoc sp. JL31]|uniref:hypothetical protein n=1 Tax=Nostoc sp. JL31 TaxID=2815395 RepID=UPI0025FDA33F|nr:hypothetical protein [Nostoc sp. JL31]MBN3891967.1 hypothetical protein [Nostoc sp. JL31]
MNEKDISKITQLKSIKLPVSEISAQTKFEIDALKIELNSALKKAIVSTTDQKTLLAIEALKEAQSKAEVPNPSGFLLKSIKQGWVPSGILKNKEAK